MLHGFVLSGFVLYCIVLYLFMKYCTLRSLAQVRAEMGVLITLYIVVVPIVRFLVVLCYNAFM